jgi:serine/threonine-protein kinase HipA
MARRARVPLNVYLNARLVGRLRREASGAIDFQYDRGWLDWENAIPVSLSLPLREDRYVGEPVVAVFENLLPDNEDIKRRLAARARAEGADAFSLLAALGRDCVGALQFLPEGSEPDPAGQIKGRALSDGEVAELLKSLGRNPLGISEDHEFRLSIAGAQEKTALLYWKDRWHLPQGTTATTHILKPQIGHLPSGIDLSNSVENEHLCLRILDALGLPVAQSEIVEFEGQRALAVKRFDRLWTRDGRLLRLPQEDLCQALSVPPVRKYQSDGGPGICDLVELLKGSDTPEADQRTVFKTVLVFWLLGAIDGHAKNFSVHLTAGGRFRLAPLYDVVSAQPSVDAGQIRHNQMKLAMAIGQNRHYVVDTIVPRHFLQTGQLCGLPVQMVESVIEELSDVGSTKIDEVMRQLPDGFPEVVASSVSGAAKRRLGLLALSSVEAE